MLYVNKHVFDMMYLVSGMDIKYRILTTNHEIFL